VQNCGQILFLGVFENPKELSTAALQAVLAAYLGLLKSQPMEPHESDVITSGGSHARYA
jgi:hypothetical protein